MFTAAQLARATLDRGLPLNAPEAVALVCDEMHAAGRGGGSFDEVAAAGRAAVRPDQVLDGVAAIVPEIRVEVLLDEGTRLFVLPGAVRSGGEDAPGAIRFADGDVPLAPAASGSACPSRTRASTRSACRPTSRSGARTRTSSSIGPPPRASGSTSPRATRSGGRPARRTRSTSSAPAGPGLSRVRRATRAPSTRRATARRPAIDPARGHRLWIRIERDLTDPADQALWGYAKNWRSGMVQHDRATTESELDTVVASAVVLDPILGVHKADIGIKDGRVAGIGPRGQPRHHRRGRPHDRAEHVADPLPRADRDAGRRGFPRAPARRGSCRWRSPPASRP